MTEREFEALTQRLGELARLRPRSYKRRVLLLALLGYGYLAGLLLLLAALLIGLLASLLTLKVVAIKLAIPVAGFAWLILRSLWVKLHAPEGIRVTADQAPELLAMIERLRRKLRAPRFHRVLITEDFNAAVVQVPILGMLGWHRNYLLVGVPLLKTLTVEQFEAVLAHEFGHLAGGHGRSANWIYRLRLSWSRLLQQIEAESHWGSFLVRPFFRWYVSYFNAYSFPLARLNEYEADAASAKLTSRQHIAQALTSVSVIGHYLGERYWPEVYRQADAMPEPSVLPFQSLALVPDAQVKREELDGWLAQTMTERSSGADTHPSLAERLSAIGWQPELALPAVGEAADRLLGPSATEIVEAIDTRWREMIKDAWREQHEAVLTGRARLQELSAKHALNQTLSFDETWELAHLEEQFGAGPEAALSVFRQLQHQYPQNVAANYALGQRLLAIDQREGVELLEQAMAQDPDAILAGAELLHYYFRRCGDEGAAQLWHQRWLDQIDLVNAARAERDFLRKSDVLLPHGLDATTIAALVEQLRAIRTISVVYLARKQVQLLPEHPLFVLGFEIGQYFLLPDTGDAEFTQKRILETVTLPGETFVLNVESPNTWARRMLKRVPDSRII